VAATGFFRSGTPIAVMVAVLALGGFLRSNHLTCASSLAFADIQDSSISQASSLSSVLQQMAQALGITVAGLTLHLSQVISAPHGFASLAPQNFILPFGAIGLASILATGVYWALPAEAGSNLHGRRRH
jgi:hypothetical protein